MPTAPLSATATPIDTALRTRALRVVPGGMTGHLSARKRALDETPPL